MTRTELPAHRICPLCGQDNKCAAGTGTVCWCEQITIPPELFQYIPPELRGKSCICERCIRTFSETGAIPK